jgi:uncharacterized protein
MPWTHFTLRVSFHVFLANRRLAVSGVALATCAVVFLCAQRLRLESGLQEMLSAAVSETDQSERARAPEPTEIAVLAEGDVLSAEAQTRIRALQQALLALSIDGAQRTDLFSRASRHALASAERGAGERIALDEIESMQTVKRLTTHDGAIEVSNVLPTDATPSAEQHRTLLEASRKRPLIDAAGRHAALLLSAPPLTDEQTVRLCRAIDATLERFSTRELRFSSLGVAVLKSELTDLLVRDMQRLFGLAIFACVCVLGLAFRQRYAVVAPLLVICLSTIWTFGTMALFDVPVTLLMLYLPAFLTCVAVGDAVHIQAAYQSLRERGMEQERAIEQALRGTWRPIVYTALTSSCGLLGLCAARTVALRQVGIFASVGIGFAMLFSFLMVPLTLAFLRGHRVQPATERPPSDFLNAFLQRASAFTAPGRRGAKLRLWGVMALLIALFAGSLEGVSRLRVQHDTLDWLPRSSRLRDAVARFDRELGGAVPMTLVIETAGEATTRSADFVGRLARLRDRLLAYDDGSGQTLIASVASLNDALDELAGVAGPDGSVLPKPWNDGEVSDLFTLAEMFAPDALRKLVSLDSRRVQLRLQLRWTHAQAYEPFLAHARAAAAEILGPQVRTHFAGAGYEMVAVLSTLLHDLRGSFLLAFLLEALTLALFLRTVRLGLIAMLPNLLPVLMVLGCMGFAGASVDVHTLLLAPIALGIVTDDTAHFMYSVRRQIRATGDVEHALRETLREVGRSITINGATLTAGFGVYLAASMQSMQRLALLVMLTIVLSLLADLVFTPALVRVTFSRAAQGGTTRSVPDNRRAATHPERP